ncbi:MULTISPECIES: hypothetical protein [Halorubrum]|uniref:hypothetical protein n=1 Tax=Halorubrum TaxID=56688 RepID=UPI000678021C|nr:MULTISPECIES: hypothetical protein [Halorubrum]TKX68896.1 hypothetical protein EXE40_11540 [Halorubrum sp. GN11GM_10-3_MGM]
MATTDSGERIRRRDVFVNLAEELQLRRSGVHSAKMAENLFRFEEGRDLVGIAHEAERGVHAAAEKYASTPPDSNEAI